MKTNTILVAILFLLLLGCEKQSELPEPEFSAKLVSTGITWEVKKGAAVIQDGEFGKSIRLYLQSDLGREPQHALSMTIYDQTIQVSPPSTFLEIDRSIDFAAGGNYGKKYNNQNWKSRTTDDCTMEVTEVKEVNGVYYISGNFTLRCYNIQEAPFTLEFQGEFENTKVFNHDLEMWSYIFIYN